MSLSPEAVDVELFSDVVLAVGVFESQVELVVLVQHVEAAVGLRSGALFRSTTAININLQKRFRYKQKDKLRSGAST